MTTVNIAPSLHQKVKLAAVRAGVKLQEYVRRALERQLKEKQ